MTKTLIIVNGFPRSGKDTFMDHYGKLWRETGLNVVKHSTVDTVKQIAYRMGWEGDKTPPNRRMLSELKDFYTKHFDGPLTEIRTMMLGTSVDMLMVAMREPEEIGRTVLWANDNGINVQTYLIRGKLEEIDHTSHSDAKVLEYPYGMTLGNHTTEEAFLESIDGFFEYMLK